VPAGPDRGGETPGSAAFIESLASAVIRSGKAADIQTLIEKLDRVPSTFGKQEQAILAGIAVHAGRRDYQPIQLEKAPGLLSRLDQFNDRAVHGRIEKLGSMFAWPGHQPAKTAGVQGTPLTEKEEKLFVQGRQQYVTICAGCHGPDGAGLEPQGPPLLDSNWVLGPEERLIRILLHGLEGPINVNGTRFEPPRILTEMPSLAALDNENIAAALTYIRHEWGHAAKPISPGVVGGTRTRTQGRVRPWTENELLAIPAGRRETKPESSN
jgi:mono/diheme cytochrome c family protein